MYCKNCGNKVDSTDKFCSNCGEKIEQEKTVYCTYCGKEILQSQTTCPHCSKRVVKSAIYNQYDLETKLLIVVSFFIPILGILLWIVLKNQEEKAKVILVAALIGILFKIYWKLFMTIIWS